MLSNIHNRLLKEINPFLPMQINFTFPFFHSANLFSI